MAVVLSINKKLLMFCSELRSCNEFLVKNPGYYEYIKYMHESLFRPLNGDSLGQCHSLQHSKHNAGKDGSIGRCFGKQISCCCEASFRLGGWPIFVYAPRE